jgi:hypothetical protein
LFTQQDPYPFLMLFVFSPSIQQHLSNLCSIFSKQGPSSFIQSQNFQIIILHFLNYLI